jgi:crotonobetainyl-CoA:carnitine CoA-transferase CaiB-like acyl-CoA transferase
MTAQSVLHHIRILDFTWVMAGPYATRLLADFGAEVIKVQPLLPLEGDDAFSRGYYNTWNRNKLGITLNLNKPEGIDLARRLAAVCDAVVENFTPRVMANWGLDYAALKKIKRDIIMVSMSMMGRTGPRRDYTGFAPTVQAASGLTGLTAFPGGPPLGPGFAYADHVSGLYASLALLGALEDRRRTGRGRHVDISQVEVMAGLIGDVSEGEGPPEALGNRSTQAAPHGVYPCADGRWCALAVFTDHEWRGFKQALGGPAWADEDRFATAVGRLANTVELDRLVAAWTKRRPAAEVMRRLRENGMAAGVVQDATDLAADPQLKARGFFVDAGWKDTPLTDASPVRLSESPAAYRYPAPSPGRDNEYVYGKLLGLAPEEIAALRKAGVI